MKLTVPNLQMPLRRVAGFTLIELLAAVAVIAILAALVMPAASNIFENSRNNGHKRNAQQIAALYNSARVAGASLPDGDDMTQVIQVLAEGVQGSNTLSTMKFQLSKMDQDQLEGAKQYLQWQPQERFINYAGAAASNGN